jgi:hypothetical protein
MAMFDDARFDTGHARDVLGTRCGTSDVLLDWSPQKPENGQPCPATDLIIGA